MKKPIDIVAELTAKLPKGEQRAMVTFASMLVTDKRDFVAAMNWVWPRWVGLSIALQKQSESKFKREHYQ